MYKYLLLYKGYFINSWNRIVKRTFVTENFFFSVGPQSTLPEKKWPFYSVISIFGKLHGTRKLVYVSYIDRHYSQYWFWIHNDDLQAFLLILETTKSHKGRGLGCMGDAQWLLGWFLANNWPQQLIYGPACCHGEDEGPSCLCAGGALCTLWRPFQEPAPCKTVQSPTNPSEQELEVLDCPGQNDESTFCLH